MVDPFGPEDCLSLSDEYLIKQFITDILLKAFDAAPHEASASDYGDSTNAPNLLRTDSAKPSLLVCQILASRVYPVGA